MSSSNCCFLTGIQISQEASLVVWYSRLFQNFPQFIMIHTVKGFGIVNKAEIDVFLELSCFLMIQQILAIWSLVPLPFLKSAWTSESSQFTYCSSLAWRILSISLLACEMSAIVWWVEHSLGLPFFGIGMKIDLFHSRGHCWVSLVITHRRIQDDNQILWGFYSFLIFILYYNTVDIQDELISGVQQVDSVTRIHISLFCSDSFPI